MLFVFIIAGAVGGGIGGVFLLLLIVIFVRSRVRSPPFSSGIGREVDRQHRRPLSHVQEVWGDVDRAGPNLVPEPRDLRVLHQAMGCRVRPPTPTHPKHRKLPHLHSRRSESSLPVVLLVGEVRPRHH